LWTIEARLTISDVYVIVRAFKYYVYGRGYCVRKIHNAPTQWKLFEFELFSSPRPARDTASILTLWFSQHVSLPPLFTLQPTTSFTSSRRDYIVRWPHRVYNKLLASLCSHSASPIVYNMYKHVGRWCFIDGDWKTFTYPKRRYFYWILLTREFARNSVLSPVPRQSLSPRRRPSRLTLRFITL